MTTFITLLKPEKLIKSVETALSFYSNTYLGYDSSIKIVTLFDYYAYVIKENNQSMIVMSKYKHSGVKYNNDSSNLFSTKNEFYGERELKWSIFIIFNNLKTMYQSFSLDEESGGDIILSSPDNSKA